MPAPDHGRSRARRCTDCAAPLAHDQRYCVECGRRAHALPAGIVAALTPDPTPSVLTGATGLQASADLGAPWAPSSTPWQAAVAIMSLLAFGVVVGGAASPRAPLALAATPPAAVAAATVAPAATTPATDATTDDSTATDDTSTAGASDALSIPAVDDSTSADDTAADPSADEPAATTPNANGLPPAKHVWVISLSGHGYDAAFGPTSASSYLSKDLPAKGELLQDYYAVAPSELSNGIAMISGQGPTPETAANCPSYTDLSPATPGADSQTLGTGCVYPTATRTIGDQLTEDGESWKAYVEGQGDGSPGQAAACRHPAVGAADTAATPQPNDPYVTWRNPFVYFHSVTDPESCATADTGLDQLKTDLATVATTPSLSYIVPSRCHDGSDTPCAPGADAGLAATDTFLRQVVPMIQASPAYQADGVIAITFDGAPQSGPEADATGCCGNPTYPNMPAATTPTATTPDATTPATTPDATTPAATTPAATTPAGGVFGDEEPGGGKVGLLLLSQYVDPGSTNMTNSYNHYSLLRGIEDLFGLDRLGYAASPTLPAFDKVVWTAKPAKAATK